MFTVKSYHRSLCILNLFLFIARPSFAAEFLDEIKVKYQQLFSKYKRINYYGDVYYDMLQLHERLAKSTLEVHKSPDLLISGVATPYILLQDPECIFSFGRVSQWHQNHFSATYQWHRNTFRATHLDIIRVYWEGYIAFLEELDGKEGEWKRFEEKFPSQFMILYPDDCVSSLPSEQLQESNKQQLLPVFFVHYSLGTFFHESKDITIDMRVKALLFWKKIDPKLEFFSSIIKKEEYRYGYIKDLKIQYNLLPETFDEGWMESQKVNGMTDGQFYENLKIVQIFGEHRRWKKSSFKTGLNTLKADNKSELVQVLHSLLVLDSKEPTIFSYMILQFLFELVDSKDGALLEMILGEHASFRNNGRVPEKKDELSLLNHESLLDAARFYKEQVKEKEEEKKACLLEAKEKLSKIKKDYGSQLEQFHESQALCLLGSLQDGVDVNGWFETFEINPLRSFEENQKAIERAYQKLVANVHSDKHSTASHDEINDLNSQESNLTEIYQTMTHKESYEIYYHLCLEQARKLLQKNGLSTLAD